MISLVLISLLILLSLLMILIIILSIKFIKLIKSNNQVKIKINNLNQQLIKLENSINNIQDNKCKICYTNNINICLIPCGHTYCSTCIDTSNNCYCFLCRKEIFSKQKIYI